MYILEGNIGAGKSTFLRLLAQQLPSVSVAFEPVQQWNKEEQGSSLLADFYQDPHRWAYALETQTMICRVKEHSKEQQHSNPWRIMERSIYSGYHCFAQNSYLNGFLTKIEWNVYQEFYTTLTQNTCQLPHGFIYLKVDPAIALERTKKRNRSAETTIPLDYLQQIDRLHNAFLINKENIADELTSVPVLVLDCNQEFESSVEVFANHCKRIEEFLLQTTPTTQKKSACPKKSFSVPQQ
jgi:deoxyadenosine/deoxycytidine kinase